MALAPWEIDMQPRRYRWIFVSLFFFVLIADQASKYGMFRGLYVEGQKSGSMDVIPGAFKFLVQYDMEAKPCDCMLAQLNGPIPPMVNHGALFSLGGDYKADANTFFLSVSILAAIAITIWAFRKSTAEDRWLCIALGMILGGTLGNLYDRIVFGGVRDFLYWYKWYNYPIFNIADCGLVCGAGILLTQAIFSKPPTPASTAPAVAGEVAGAPAPVSTVPPPATPSA